MPRRGGDPLVTALDGHAVGGNRTLNSCRARHDPPFAAPFAAGLIEPTWLPDSTTESEPGSAVQINPIACTRRGDLATLREHLPDGVGSAWVLDGQECLYYSHSRMVDALSADWLSPAEAADLLGVSPRRVYALIDDGRLHAERVGGRLLVHRDSVEARASGATANGRPFSARRGWALLLLAAGLDPVGLPPDARSKLRRILREQDLWALRARFDTRAERRVLRAHSSDLARIAADPEVVRSGAGAAADAGLPLVAPGAPLEVYVDAAAAERLVDRYRLSPSPRGNVTLRVVPDEVRAWLPDPVAPWPAVALDLAEDGDPRSRDVARSALSRS